MIQLIHVSKTYDRRPALSDLTLDIEKGEFVLLMGPSGAGKSTLLRMLIAAEIPDEGQIFVQGKNSMMGNGSSWKRLHYLGLPHALVPRAKIVLAAAKGEQSGRIAQELGVSRHTVGMWRGRFVERGIEGLYDEYRSGRPRSIEDERISQLVKKTLHSKPRGATQWSCREMADATGISKSTV